MKNFNSIFLLILLKTNCLISMESVNSPKAFRMVELEEEQVLPVPTRYNNYYSNRHSHLSLNACLSQKQKDMGSKTIENEIFGFIKKHTNPYDVRDFIIEKRKNHPNLIEQIEEKIINNFTIQDMQETDIRLYFAVLIGANNWIKENLSKIKDQINKKVGNRHEDAEMLSPMELAIHLKEYNIASMLFEVYDKNEPDYKNLRKFLKKIKIVF